MEIFDNPEKMVAGSCYYCAYYFGDIDCIGWNIGYGPVYLHFILMKKNERHKELETILVLVLALVLLYWSNKKQLFLTVAFITGLTGLLISVTAKAVHWLWMKLAEGMGRIMNKIILAVVFVVIVIPLGWISKKAGKSSVRLTPGDKSYYKERNHTYTPEDIRNLW